ncbi:MAG: hydrogenase small subunit [Coriobacteriia bacterium]|nr:hydrogenase small subunit [Coriobacteriia bacterium]
MEITRRELLSWAAVSAVGLGLGLDNLSRLEQALAAPGAPTVIWLQGSSCSGCSISLLNAASTPIEDVLTKKVDLAYHPDLTAAYGEAAITSMFDAAAAAPGGFILCIEGAVPVAASGNYCIIGERNGVPLTLLTALQELGPKAKAVVAVGTCAAFGGVVKPSKVTQVRTVADALVGRTTAPIVNLPGCPAHPDTVLGTLITVITGGRLPLDSLRRPTAFYNTSIHSRCPRRESDEVGSIGRYGCYEEIGCRGPSTVMACPSVKWNNGRNWCVAANQACIGCAAPDFPTNPLLSGGEGGDGGDEGDD